MAISNKKFLAFTCLSLLPWVASAEVSPPKLVAERATAHCQIPRWSPDGKKLAFEVYLPKNDSREVWIATLGPGDSKLSEEEVTTGKTQTSDLLGDRKAPVVEFAWAPDMKMLSKPYVFSSIGPKKNFDLFADGSWLTNNPGNDGQPDWSTDGRYIAYTSQRKASGDVYALDLQGDSTPMQLTFWPSDTVYRPRFAAHTNRLLFTRSQTGSKGQSIGVIDFVTDPKQSVHMVTEWNGDEIRPEWSPDGTKIAFFANKGNANDKVYDLWVIGSDGKNQLRLARNVVVPDYTGPVWTPDSSTILFVAQDFKKDNPVMFVRADNSAKGVLATGTELNSDLALFAQGDTLHLAFKAIGHKGATEKTWERIYVVTFTMADLKGSAPTAEPAPAGDPSEEGMTP